MWPCPKIKYQGSPQLCQQHTKEYRFDNKVLEVARRAVVDGSDEGWRDTLCKENQLEWYRKIFVFQMAQEVPHLWVSTLRLADEDLTHQALQGMHIPYTQERKLQWTLATQGGIWCRYRQGPVRVLR